MGYFANGSEGTDYEQRYCARCVHGDGEGAGTCAVWLLHLLHNYDPEPAPRMLNVLIPRDAEGWNTQCAMFTEREGR